MSLRPNTVIPTKRLLLGPVIALVLAFLVALAGCSSDAEQGSSTTVRTVHAQTARAVSTVNTRSFSGTLRAPLETNLSFRVPGQVTDVRVDVGTRVEAGELIARLDAEDYRLEVEAARASYRRAKAAAENAKAELKRIKALYADDNASLSAYDRARTNYETAKNQAEAAERQLDLAQKRLGYTRLTAPASGSIADKMVQEGENVSVGRPVARLTAGDRLEVQVQVPEDLISDIEVGRSVTVTSTAVPGTKVDGTVTEVASAPNGRRPTYPVVVTLDRSVEALRSGMSARVGFGIGEQNGFVVPSGAVSRDQQGEFVYVVDTSAPDTTASSSAASSSTGADGVVRRRAVTTGELTAEGIIVRGDVQSGDRVITAGLSTISHGDKVRLSRLFTDDR
jgi:RND family efflux transporter MFP subunit